jgi:S-adenosylmethionine hydrolase
MLPVSFLSDFGRDDEFVGLVHGVIARLAPGVRIIDVSHGVRRGDVRAGALALLRAVQYMPEGVFLAVVDPGVGGDRRPVALRTGWGFFVGPDNGLLAPAVAMVGGADDAVVLTDPQFRLPTEGATFEGRDVFAPAAAVLASGEASLGELGPEIDAASLTPLLLPLPEQGDGYVQGEVWWIDRFGNAQTNIGPDDLQAAGMQPGDRLSVRVGAAGHPVQWVAAYTDVEEAAGLTHIDSYGMMALSVRGGRADESFGVAEGMSVGFRPGPTGAAR